ncbi:hypothetical protein T265_14368 [Opisthorchis viverrini]|uniref:SET domain-containing protein n=1 Tax=Opisthorchis viverrini TaxID=6198 RepID=A0A074ZBY4_OPIVI|nr:hypothetical protein T265_14368 [Opisthorchis viverrini]KER24643.1 hypothetical protein T265_14368 [Opisthorchis viverrini]
MPADLVSSLWSRLLDIELNIVKKNDKLAERLLKKPFDCQTSTLYSQMAEGANSTQTAARYYHSIVKYIEDKEASEGLRRILCFIEDLSSGEVEVKNVEKARQFRESGNRFFRSGKLSRSSELYRQALLHAPHAFPLFHNHASPPMDSTEAALLHGNLSAVFARQQSWTACLWESIIATELHLIANRPGICSLVRRLWSRITQCCDHIGLSYPKVTLPELHHVVTIRQAFLQLSTASDVGAPTYELPEPRYGFQEAILRCVLSFQYPGLSCGLLVTESKQKGRYVVATEEFQPGDVLAVEPASGWPASGPRTTVSASGDCLLLLPSQRMSKCTACLNPLSAIGYLCPNCCDTAYCAPPSKCFFRHLTKSDEVVSFSQPPWHTAECRFMFLLNSTGLGHLCFRLAWLRRKNHRQMSSRQLTIDQLVSHFDEFEVEDLFQYAVTAWLLAKLLSRSFCDQDTMTELIDGLWCFDTLRRLQCNAHAITDVQETFQLEIEDETYHALPRLGQVRVATALFPCVSMLNHACEPSVSNSFENQFIILRCTKPIHLSDEVYNCYGPHYLHDTSNSSRRAQLQKQYFFNCSCQHCANPRCAHVLKPTTAVQKQWDAALSRMMRVTETNSPTLPELQNTWSQACQIGTLSCPFCDGHWWPQGESPGSLWDTAGQRCITAALTTLDPHISNRLKLLGVQCFAKSVDWVSKHFGDHSSEYLWELLNFFRTAVEVLDQWPSGILETHALSIPTSLEGVRKTIFSLACLLYGQRNAKEIEGRFL